MEMSKHLIVLGVLCWVVACGNADPGPSSVPFHWFEDVGHIVWVQVYTDRPFEFDCSQEELACGSAPLRMDEGDTSMWQWDASGRWSLVTWAPKEPGDA